MLKRLYEYLDSIFALYEDHPLVISIREELLADLTDKFEDLRQRGVTEEEAFNTTVASIGDIGELLETIKHKNSGNPANGRYRFVGWESPTLGISRY